MVAGRYASHDPSTRDGNAEIYVMRADGSDVRRLTNDSASDASPTWSPDGSAIAFVSDRDGTRDLYVMRPDGQGLTRLTVGAGVTKDVPRWAPGYVSTRLSDRAR